MCSYIMKFITSISYGFPLASIKNSLSIVGNRGKGLYYNLPSRDMTLCNYIRYVIVVLIYLMVMEMKILI